MAWKASYKQTPECMKDGFLRVWIIERKEAIASEETYNHARMKREIKEMEAELINRKHKKV